MATVKTHYNRRSFLKISAIGGAGLLIHFSWLSALAKENPTVEEAFKLNGFIKIDIDGKVTISSPNPEIGQNVKTSMPMIVAEELDVNWADVSVVQAPLNTDIFKRQLAGGSESIKQSWDSLRMAGATAKHMLVEAASNLWKVSPTEIKVEKGVIYHEKTGKSVGFGEIASAASKISIPEKVEVKNISDFKIIRNSHLNVDGPDIITGKPVFGFDYYQEGMLIAMIIHPPAFGLKLKSFDKSEALKINGIVDIFSINTFQDGYKYGPFDITAFPQLIVVVGDSTWQIMKAKKLVKVDWEENKPTLNNNKKEVFVSTDQQFAEMIKRNSENCRQVRKDGEPEKVFANAAKVIERTYTAPYLAHSPLEPLNFFADVTKEKAILIGPIQTPEYMEKSVATRLGMSLDQVDIQMTRVGGGFGRKLYGHYLVEAAVISQKLGKPIKLIYSREDDMTFGVYRPTYLAHYKAALDKDNNLIAFHVKAGGVSDSPLYANRFPAGAVENYLAEDWRLDSNVTTGSFRAPRSNFMGAVEQAFLDEVAELAEKDPIDFRLELLAKAKTNPVGKKNDYNADRYAGVLKLVREKSEWDKPKPNIHRGVAAYFCHNSYVADVVEIEIKNGKPIIEKVFCTVDCGIVVNPISASNMVEGGTIDGIGHALYTALTLKDGVPQQNNFNNYKLIRNNDAPRNIEVHFVQSDIHPTGLGEPPFAPAIGALANSLYKATGKRFYNQPFMPN